MFCQIVLVFPLLFPISALGLSLQNNKDSFSLSAYQRARAEETSKSLDASRFHFQILFVDNDNFHGRIVEGVMARVAEYNDALFTLFPSSATLDSSSKAPLDAAAPDTAVAICDSLCLCSTRSRDFGTSFDLSYLDEYDLVITMDDDIRTHILRSLPAKGDQQSYYGAKCRLLSEFFSVEFCVINQEKDGDDILLDMLEPDLREAASPYLELLREASSDVFSMASISWKDIFEPRMVLSETGAAVANTQGWPKVQAGILLATAGLTRFCLDTMDAQLEAAFQNLLELHFCRKEHLDFTFDQADEQMRKGSLSVSGYFSPEQRRTRFHQYLERLRVRLNEIE